MTFDIIFLHSSYLLTLIALAIREILWLRIVLSIAQCGHLVHSYMNVDFNKGIWTLIFVIINIVQILIIYRDRKELMIPEQIYSILKQVENFYIFGIKENYVILKKKLLLEKVKSNLTLCLC